MKHRVSPHPVGEVLREARWLGLAVFIAFVAVRLAQAAESSITAVTVYTDRAVVTRSAELKLEKTGVQELSFDGLPMNLLEQSLQVSGKGSARVTILDVAAKTEHLEVTPNERIRVLENELTGLTRQQAEIGDREEILKQQDAFLVLIRAASLQSPPKGQDRIPVEDYAKLLAFQQEQLTAQAKARQGLAVEREALQVKMDAVMAQLNDLRGARGRDVKLVTVRVDVASPGALALNFKYTIPGAAWWPSYDARLRSDERRVDLSYFGVVRNGTGEDWNQVQLTLSTAKPSLGGGAPEFRPWIVDVLRPMPAMAASPSMKVKRAELKGMLMTQEDNEAMSFGAGANNAPAAPPPPPEFEAEASSASVETGQSSATFKLGVPITLKADNSVQKVAIATLPLKAELRHEVTPKLRETAYLAAKVENSSEYPLLAGELNSFLDDSFVATGRLKTVMAGEKFDLALGADESVAVKRRLVNRFRETVGITSRTNRVTYEVSLVFTNNRKTVEQLEFSEPLPVSRDERIEVKLLQPAERELGTKEAPKAFTREEEGKFVGRIELKAGEKREITLKYQVEYPQDLQVLGLE